MHKNFGKMTVEEREKIKNKNMREMESKLTKSQLDWYKNISDGYKMNYLKAITTNSKTIKIKAKCLDCCCWQIKEITMCSVSHCPLWSVRPYQNAL